MTQGLDEVMEQIDDSIVFMNDTTKIYQVLVANLSLFMTIKDLTMENNCLMLPFFLLLGFSLRPFKLYLGKCI